MKKIRMNDQGRKEEMRKKKTNNTTLKATLGALTPNLDSVFDKKNDGKKKDLMAAKAEEVKEGDKKYKLKLHKGASSTDKRAKGKKGKKDDDDPEVSDEDLKKKGVK